MPSYGLLPEGFVPKPQTVIKEELDTVYKNTFGAQLGSEPDGSIPADSVAGQRIGLHAERMAELMQLVEEVAFARLDQRLAKLLLARNETVLGVTHQQLADELGSVREIVSRLLKGFAEQGLVTLGREQITITNRPGLQKLAAV